MNKICRGFLWCAKAHASGGQCAVAWDSVCSPKWAVGLGLPNLQWLNIAFQARWPWLQWSDPSHSWSEFRINVPDEARQLFRVAARSTVGNGQSTLFWEDRWLDGHRVQELAPTIFARVSRVLRSTRTVHSALQDDTWARDIGPELNAGMLDEYLGLWTRIMRVDLDVTQNDAIAWLWEPNGCYSTRSAYAAKFWGREVIPMADFTWKSRAPLRWCFFCMTCFAQSVLDLGSPC